MTHMDSVPDIGQQATGGEHEAIRALRALGERADALAGATEADGDPQDALVHPAHQVYFRAGLIACREYMARFVEAESPSIAMSIRANWWPALGKDYGPPRKLDFNEVTDGEYGTAAFRTKTADEVSPTQEALPIALAFLSTGLPAAREAPSVGSVSTASDGENKETQLPDRAAAVPPGSNAMVCLCGDEFATHEDMARHLVMVHDVLLTERFESCEQCGFQWRGPYKDCPSCQLQAAALGLSEALAENEMLKSRP